MIEPNLKFFDFAHLKPELQAYSQPFHDLAHRVYNMFPPNAERGVALRKILEAKDEAIRDVILDHK